MQTSQNDQRQLVRELHQNQSVGTSQILADGSLLIIALILTRTISTGRRQEQKFDLLPLSISVGRRHTPTPTGDLNRHSDHLSV